MATVSTLQTPPTLSGAAPLIGHSASFLRNPVELLKRGYAEHGRIFALNMGNRKAVVLLGPEYNKFFFGETDKLLSIREGYPFFHRMFSKDFFFLAKFDDYLNQRKIVMPRFKGDAMRGYVGLMAEETHDLVESLGDEGEIDLIPTLGPLVMNIAAHAFLGRDFRQKLSSQFFEDFRDFSGGMEVIYPLWLPLPHLRRSSRAKKKLHKILAQWIQWRRANPLDPPDFFQGLVDAKLHDGSPLTEETTIHLILLLVWAGHETTAGQICWSLIDLLQHPEYLEEVRSEARIVLGESEGESATWKDARDLVKMELALKESERLHPVAYVLMRQAAQDIELDNFLIKQGTMVFAAPSATHRLPDVFEHPHVYRPSRFTSGTGEKGPEANALIGFGGGQHRCAGVNFARLEMKMVLTMLLKKYDMELIDEPRPAPGPLTYWPASPTRIRYRKRRETALSESETFARQNRDGSAITPPAECPFHQA